MAITQDRVMTIIAAGLDYQQALRRLIQMIENSQDIIMLQTLAFEHGLLKKPIQSATVLAIEDRHFRRVHSANTHRKHKQIKRRRDAGVPERVTAPASLMTLDEITGVTQSTRLEQTFADSPEIAALRLQFPDMPADKFAAIIRESELISAAAAGPSPKLNDAPGLYDDSPDILDGGGPLPVDDE